MNKSKPISKRQWGIWKNSGAIANVKGPVVLKVNAVSHKSFAESGCSYCGYRSGNSPISGGGSAMWQCGECRKTTVILGEGVIKSTIGIGTKNGSIYPKLRKHPREGIPSHGAQDLKPDNGEFFRSRGIGLDSCTCFVCGNNEEPRRMMNNICAYVSCKDAGERAVALFEKGARLDYREWEPDYVQVKIGACEDHLLNLKILDSLIDADDIITKDIISKSMI